MKKVIALLLCFVLLLCGCGSTGSEASEVSSAPVASSESTPVEEAQQEASIDENGAPTDPVELAKWVWALAEEAEKSIEAEDYDLSIVTEVDLNGTYTSTQSSVRVKEINSQENPMAYAKTETNGEISETWYGDGMMYQSSSLGNFKYPMSYDEYQAQEDTSDESHELLEINPDSFSSMSATTSNNYYTVVFSKPTLDTWMAFADLLGVDENTTCTAFDLSGTLQCDFEGNINQLKLEMTFTVDVSSIPMTIKISVNQLTMGLNDQVTVELPTGDFAEFEDTSILTALVTTELVTASQPNLQYQNVRALTLEGNTVADVVTEENNITYITGENGLSARWDTQITINDEPDYWQSDVYENGSGVISDATGDSSYTYDDSTFVQDVQAFIFSTANSLSAGSDFSLGDGMLTYNLSENFVQEQVTSMLSDYGVDYFITEGTVESISGNMLYCLDDSGLLLSQLMTLTVEVTYDGDFVTITALDGGDVLAIGADVVMPQ